MQLVLTSWPVMARLPMMIVGRLSGLPRLLLRTLPSPISRFVMPHGRGRAIRKPKANAGVLPTQS